MERTGLFCLLLAGGVALSGPRARGGNPYETIVERNAFALRPLPTPPRYDESNNRKANPPKISLTGITILNRRKKAWMTLTEPNNRNAPAKHISLGEGQRSGDVQVVEIREKTGEVKVVNAGETVTVSLKDNRAGSVSNPPRFGAAGAKWGRAPRN